MPIHNIVIRYPRHMVHIAFCDLLHTFHKQVTNISQHIFFILLWGNLTSPPKTNRFLYTCFGTNPGCYSTNHICYFTNLEGVLHLLCTHLGGGGGGQASYTFSLSVTCKRRWVISKGMRFGLGNNITDCQSSGMLFTCILGLQF